MENIERRILPDAAELRAVDDGKEKVLQGYAARYNVRSGKIGGKFYERLMPGAFRKVLNSKPDVRFLSNHQPDVVYGRTASGTLMLNEDARGLAFRCTLPNTQAARDLHESIRRGDVTGMSFGFLTDDDEWGQEDVDGEFSAIRSIKNISKLMDVSAVAYPAYENASVEARSSDHIVIPTFAPKVSQVNAEDQAWLDVERAKLVTHRRRDLLNQIMNS